MFNYRMITERQSRMNMPFVNSSNINSMQKLTESTAVSALSPFSMNKINKKQAEYIASIMKYAQYTSGVLESTVARYIATNIIPGIKNLSEFKNCLEFDTMMNDNKDIIIESIHDYSICDRIINNNNTISKRFNINKIIRESTDIPSSIHAICEMIDTYDMPIYSKYNVALENITFSINMAGKQVDPGVIVENVTDYFLLYENRLSDNTFKKMKKVLENNIMITESDINSSYMAKALLESEGVYAQKIKVLASRASNEDVSNAILSVNTIENEKDAQQVISNIGALVSAKHSEVPDDDKSLLFGALNLINSVTGISSEFINIEINKNVNVPGSKFGMIIPAEVADDDVNLSMVSLPIKEMSTEELAHHIFTEDVKDNEDLKKLIADFKADQDKNEPKLRRLFTKFYAKSPESVIDELPSIFSIVRIGFIAALIPIPYIGPVLALVIGLINWFLRKDINVKQCDKLLTCLKNELKLVDDKIDNASSDEEKKRFTQYKNELEKAISKVEDYATELDGETRTDASAMFDDFDFDLDESVYFMNDLLSIVETTAKVEYSMLSKDEKQLSLNSVSENSYIDNYYLSRPGILSEASIKELRSIAESLVKSDPDSFRDYMHILYKSSLCEAAYDILEDLYYDNYHKDYAITTEASLVWQKENEQYTSDITLESMVITGYCNNAVKSILESSSKLNSVKLLIQDAKRNINNLSTKAKSASMTANAYASSVVNGIEKSMTSDRREAIIKGRVLPSFTQMVKYAIAIAAAGIIFQPAGAVISAIGLFAVNKALTYREKQMILDEIETELKVVEKQINIAENDGDMKQYRILLNMQKSLIRERQRIKYNMKAVGKNVPIPSVSAGRED